MSLLAAVRQGATLPAHASRALRRATTDSHKNRLDTTDETDRWDADQPALWTCVCAITARVLGIGADCSSGLAASLGCGCCLAWEQGPGGAGAQVRSRECLLEGAAGAGVHHWCASCVDGRDDLLGVDPFQVGAGR